MKRAQQKTQPIDTDLVCRTKANAWGKDEDKETREALFNYLLMRARCQRQGDLSLLEHVHLALKLYAKLAKYRPSALDGGNQERPSSAQRDNQEQRE